MYPKALCSFPLNHVEKLFWGSVGDIVRLLCEPNKKKAMYPTSPKYVRPLLSRGRYWPNQIEIKSKSGKMSEKGHFSEDICSILEFGSIPKIVSE